MKITHCLYAALVGVVAVLPQVTQAADPSLQGLIVGTNDFVNTILIPAVLAIAFFIFVVNVVRFFIIGGANEEGQKNAKSLALYSVGAFVFILSFWGIVNLLNSSIGLDNDPCISYTSSDYVQSDSSLAPCSPRPQIDNDAGGGTWLAPGMGGDADIEPVPFRNTQPPSDNDAESVPWLQPGMGGDADEDGDAETLYRLQLQRQNLVEKMSGFISTQAGEMFGGNYEEVVSELLSPLTSPASSHSQLEELQATYRLWRLGQIEEQEYESYLSAVNTLRAISGQLSITTEQVTASIQRPLPELFIDNQGTLADSTRLVLEIYNETAPSHQQINVDSLVNGITNIVLPYSHRRTRLDCVTGVGDRCNTTYIEMDQALTIRHLFTMQMNTEALYQGDFTQIVTPDL